ncbi:GH-E family nuclease [Burkholderia sp. IMCC1007]|uniref:GH-E family nuclease n=1 Tax=Burkholderia sp. IMCC1007 TaxID=3004104 RepID=UPI003FA41234
MPQKNVTIPRGQSRRDWDVDHRPPWSPRDLSGMTTDQVADECNKCSRLECSSCNSLRGDKPAGQ